MAHGRAFPPIRKVLQQACGDGIRRGENIANDCGRCISRTVIDDNDFAAWALLLEKAQSTAQSLPDSIRFVESGNDQGKGREHCPAVVEARMASRNSDTYVPDHDRTLHGAKTRRGIFLFERKGTRATSRHHGGAEWRA